MNATAPDTVAGWFYLAGVIITVGVPAVVTLVLQFRSHRVLTKNHHESKKPTIPDRLDNIERALETLIANDKKKRKKK